MILLIFAHALVLSRITDVHDALRVLVSGVSEKKFGSASEFNFPFSKSL